MQQSRLMCARGARPASRRASARSLGTRSRVEAATAVGPMARAGDQPAVPWPDSPGPPPGGRLSDVSTSVSFVGGSRFRASTAGPAGATPPPIGLGAPRPRHMSYAMGDGGPGARCPRCSFRFGRPPNASRRGRAHRRGVRDIDGMRRPPVNGHPNPQPNIVGRRIQVTCRARRHERLPDTTMADFWPLWLNTAL